MSAVAAPPAPVVAEIVRSGFVEGHHYGSLVALDTTGRVAWSVGQIAAPMLPRSCNKPLSRRWRWSGSDSTCRRSCSP